MIRAEQVSKRYRIGGPARRTTNLREALVQSLRWRRRSPEAPAGTFWALEDVSFELGRGDVLGIIGRNGAGKSTLLKVLSRITEPTRGRIELHGRIASLLEVGTGFHPELTGRENIYLNGTLLGMRKREIDRKFDEIVDFAEVGPFIDTPTKRYSSGMYVRLAFAVAAHLEPEILVVDEVLAVGDAAFQKKCLGKMSDVAHAGRTVLFVSHNMAAMRALCSRALYLQKGRVVVDGSVQDAVTRYLAQSSTPGESSGWSYRRHGTQFVIDGAELLSNGVPTRAVQSGDRCTMRLHYRVIDPKAVGSEAQFFFMIFGEGQKLANCWTNASHGRGIRLAESGTIDCVIPRWPFRGQSIRVDVFSAIGFEAQEWIEEVLAFESYDGDFYGTGMIPYAGEGVLFLEHQWHVSEAIPESTADGGSLPQQRDSA